MLKNCTNKKLEILFNTSKDRFSLFNSTSPICHRQLSNKLSSLLYLLIISIKFKQNREVIGSSASASNTILVELGNRFVQIVGKLKAIETCKARDCHSKKHYIHFFLAKFSNFKKIKGICREAQFNCNNEDNILVWVKQEISHKLNYLFTTLFVLYVKIQINHVLKHILFAGLNLTLGKCSLLKQKNLPVLATTTKYKKAIKTIRSIRE